MTPELLIILPFLALCLAIGAYASRGIRTIRDYSTGSTTYATPVLLSTLLATFVGANTLVSFSARGFREGIHSAFTSAGVPLVSLVIAFFLAGKAQRLKNKLSLAHAFGDFYGPAGQITAGVLSFLMTIFFVSAQMVAIGSLLDSLLGVPWVYSIGIGGSIIVLYSALGGIRSVILTDTLQFLFLIVMIPIALNIIIGELGGLGVFLRSIPESHLQLFPESTNFIKQIEYLILWFIPFLHPPIFQRILMAKDPKQARSIFYIMVSIQVPLYLLISIIGIAAYLLNPSIDSQNALIYLIKNHLPFWFKALAVIGLASALMSTIDSYLNSAGITLTHDAIKPLFAKQTQSSDKQELQLARCATLLLGAISILVAVHSTTIIQNVIFALSIWNPTIIIPLIGLILGVRATQMGFFAAIISGGLTTLAWNLSIPDFELDGQLPGMVVNGFIFSLSAYTNRARWEWVKSSDAARLPRGAWWRNLLAVVSIRTSGPSTILHFVNRRVNSAPPFYQTFAIFAILNYLVPFFMWSYEAGSPQIQLFLRVIACFLCMGLLIKDTLPKKWDRFVSIYWQFTVLFCLPFSSTFLLFDSGGAFWTQINLVLSLILSAFLLDWMSFIILSLLGFFSGFVFSAQMDTFEFFIPDVALVYILLFTFFVGIFFSRSRGIQHSEQVEQTESMKSLAGTIAHEMRTPLSTINMAARSLQRAMPDLVDGHAYCNKSYLEKLPKNLEITSQRANMTIDLLLSSLKGAEKVDENEVFSLRTVLEEAIAEYPFSNNEENLIHLKVFCDFELRGSPHLFRHIFFNLIKNAFYSIQAAGKGEITIEIRKESKGSLIIFRDTGKGMSESDASRVFDRFFTKSTGGTGLGLSFCEAVVHRHGGTITCEARPGEWAQFIMVFP